MNGNKTGWHSNGSIDERWMRQTSELERKAVFRKCRRSKLWQLLDTGVMQMSVNNFRPRKFEDFEIVDASAFVVGHIRVKPSGVLWAGPNSKVWYGVSLKVFQEFMEQNGKKQKK